MSKKQGSLRVVRGEWRLDVFECTPNTSLSLSLSVYVYEKCGHMRGQKRVLGVLPRIFYKVEKRIGGEVGPSKCWKNRQSNGEKMI